MTRSRWLHPLTAKPLLTPLLLLLLQAQPAAAGSRPPDRDASPLLADLGTLMRPQQRRDRLPDLQRLALAAPPAMAALPVRAVAAAARPGQPQPLPGLL